MPSTRHPRPAERPLGLRVIIAYKFVKAVLMLSAALFLALAPEHAGALLAHLARELSEGGSFLRRVGEWLQLHQRLVAEARAIALLDGVSTAVEGVLLYQGKT